MAVNDLVGMFVKLFLLLTPFFVLSVFVTLCDGMERAAKRKLAIRTTFAIWVVCVIIYFFGDTIFRYLGLTLDAFQVGAGILLLLSGIELVRGTSVGGVRRADPSGDLSVVPLAIPYTVGPGTIGTLLVMGASDSSMQTRLMVLAAITTAVVAIGALLIFADALERILRRKGLDILSKLTGLFLAALASQLILGGMRNVLFKN